MSKGYRIKFDRTASMRPRTRAAAAKALEDISEDCLREANKTVPIEEGTLARSGTAQSDPDALTAAVGYDTPYAVKQHEDPTLQHDEGRRHHWLERTVAENQDRYQEYLRQAIRKAL